MKSVGLIFVSLSILWAAGALGASMSLGPVRIEIENASQAAEVQQALELMQNLEISSAPLEGRYNPEIVGDNFWAFFSKRIQSVKAVPAENVHCDKGAVAFVEQTESPNVAFVCPLFFDKTFSIYEKISILLHESRHVEGHSHVMCLSGGKVANTGGCDERIEDKGSYAVSVETLAKMALRGKNVPAEERKRLRLMLLEMLDSFNQPVQGLGNSGIYLENANGKDAYFFDGVKLNAVPRQRNAHLVSRTLSLLSFPLNGSDAFGVDIFTHDLKTEKPLGGCALAYNSLPPSERSLLVDIVQDGVYSACIYQNKVVGRIGLTEGKDASLKVPFVIREVFTSDELAQLDRDSLFVRSDKGDFYRLRFVEDQFKLTQVKDISKGFQHLFFFNSDLTGLRRDGRLMKVDFETNKWIPYPGLEKMRFKNSTRPFFWSLDLMETL